MTKSELISRISLQYPDLSLKHIKKLVDIIIEQMTAALENGDSIEIRGFGSLSKRKRRARVARNPRTSETIKIDERYVIYFRMGKELKERLNPPSNDV